MGPRAGLDGRKSRSHRDSIPDRPARSSVAIPTELPGPLYTHECIKTKAKVYTSTGADDQEEK